MASSVEMTAQGRLAAGTTASLLAHSFPSSILPPSLASPSRDWLQVAGLALGTEDIRMSKADHNSNQATYKLLCDTLWE